VPFSSKLRHPSRNSAANRRPLSDGILDLAGNPSMTQMGFPVLQPDEVPPCGNPVPCNRTRMLSKLWAISLDLR
jgi:hypothetical protein